MQPDEYCCPQCIASGYDASRTHAFSGLGFSIVGENCPAECMPIQDQGFGWGGKTFLELSPAVDVAHLLTWMQCLHRQVSGGAELRGRTDARHREGSGEAQSGNRCWVPLSGGAAASQSCPPATANHD